MDYLNIDPNDPDLPEPIRNALLEQQRQNELMHMAQQDSIHHKQEFLESLDESQLKELRSILDWVDGAPSANGYIQGLVTWLLRQKFGHCICGENHSDELQKQNDDKRDEPVESVPQPDYDALAKEYGVMFADDQTTGVICVECGHRYISLDDRMLRKPGQGGCIGCQHKTKWG
jgi:hypothetical protein